MYKKNKILFIITDFGSFNNFLSELCLRLIQKYEFEVSVICSKNKVINCENKFNFDAIDINFFFIDIPRGFNMIKQITTSKKINSIIKHVQPDIINAHFTTAIFTTLLLKNNKTKIWGSFHGLGSPVSKGLKKYIFKLIEYFCFTRLEKIIVLNEIDFNSIPKLFRNKLIKINSLGLGCDLKKFNNNKFNINEKSRIKKTLNIEKQFILGFTGRFVNFKGFDILAKSFIELSLKYKNRYKLILIGGRDPIHSTGLKPEEEKQFFNNPDVIEIGFTNDVDKYLSIVDLFIFPSKKEGIPISITEALAMEIPVITFNSRGCNDLVKNEYNGILIEKSASRSKEIVSFLNSILKLSNNKVLFNNLKINAKNNRANLSREHFIKEQAEMFLNSLK